MLKKNKSQFFIYNKLIFNSRNYKSCNDLVNLQNNTNKRKLISYGEFLRSNPRATKKQRINAIATFYNLLLGKNIYI